MGETQDLRRICLLAAASSLAQHNKGNNPSSRRIQYEVRCVVYMLVAFSLRRRNLGRRDLRTPTANPNSPNSSRLRFSGNTGAAAFRARMRKRLASLFISLPHKRGCLAIDYM